MSPLRAGDSAGVKLGCETMHPQHAHDAQRYNVGPLSEWPWRRHDFKVKMEPTLARPIRGMYKANPSLGQKNGSLNIS